MMPFKFLIMEDNNLTLTQLEKLLRERFPDSEVDVAETVEQGWEYVRKAEATGDFYDALILDFSLPREVGENAEVDTSLSEEAQRLADLGHQLLIVHITAYADDQTVKRHVQKTQLERLNPNAITWAKGDTEWPTKLIKWLKTCLYGNEIQREMAAVFGGSYASLGLSRDRERAGIGLPGGMTHRLAALCRMIETHWRDLDEGLRQKIRRVLQVEEDSGTINVGILLREPEPKAYEP